jgi:hypothetical protein
MNGRDQILKATMGVLADLGITPPTKGVETMTQRETKNRAVLIRIDATTAKALEALIQRWQQDDPDTKLSNVVRRAIVYTERATRPAAEKE